MEKLKANYRAYLSLGSNLGDRLRHLEHACLELTKRVGDINHVSSIYENPPLGFESDDQFYNLCVEIQTDLSPNELLFEIKQIEKNIGRKQKGGPDYESRVIDIDILYINDLVIVEDDLIVPHPRIGMRNFVLVPLLEIAPDLFDSKAKLSVSAMLAKGEDDSILKKVKSELQL